MYTVDHNHSIVEIQNVSFSYGKETVVKEVTLEIHKGDYVGIIGPNGGGKSTLMKLMVGLLTPDAGSISLFGNPIKEFRDWYKIGYIPQRSTFDKHFPITVEEVVLMGRFGRIGLFHQPSDIDKVQVHRVLKEVEMYDYRHRQIHDLSGGQQQRVFIAKALASEPEIIFLDEPTVGVDIKTQKQFYSLLRKLNKELRLTLILVSHELDVVAHESTELGYINCTMEYYGDPEEFLKGQYFHDLIGKKGMHH